MSDKNAIEQLLGATMNIAIDAGSIFNDHLFGEEREAVINKLLSELNARGHGAFGRLEDAILMGLLGGLGVNLREIQSDEAGQ